MEADMSDEDMRADERWKVLGAALDATTEALAATCPCPDCGADVPAERWKRRMGGDWFGTCPGCGCEQSQEVEVDE